MEYKWTVNRIADTLAKYNNHQILSIEKYDNYIAILIEYISEKHKSKTRTRICIYADGVCPENEHN